MSYTQWEGTLSEAHNNRGLLKIIWLTNCMLIYKVYVYLAIQDLLETARVPIYIHTYIGNFFSVNLCKIWPLCPQRVACGWKFFAHILDLNLISQNQGKKQRKKTCSKLISLKCQYHAWPFKKKTITTHR